MWSTIKNKLTTFYQNYKKTIYFKINNIILIGFLVCILFNLLVIYPISQTKLFQTKFYVTNENYQTKVIKDDNQTLEFPYFKSKKLDTKINEIINIFKLSNFNITHDTYVVNNEYVNVFFRLGNEKKVYKSFLIKVYNGEETSIKDILKPNCANKFYDAMYKALDQKYPKFIYNAIKDGTGDIAYNIRENKMTIYFSNFNVQPEYKEDIFIVLNYHAIKDLLDYTFKLDAANIDENFIPLDSKKKTVAITFDDGPSVKTNDVIQVLKDNKAGATFFMLGSRMNKYPEILKNVKNSGFEIASHTYSHKYLTRLNDKDLHKEFNRTNDAYKKVGGQDIKLVRPPYGNLNEKVRNEFPVSYIMWSIDSRDWESKDAQKIKKVVLNNVKDGDIILLHDLYLSTVEGTRLILPELYVRGFQVVSVSKLAELKGITLEPNTVYRSIK